MSLCLPGVAILPLAELGAEPGTDMGMLDRGRTLPMECIGLIRCPGMMFEGAIMPPTLPMTPLEACIMSTCSAKSTGVETGPQIV